MKRWLWGLGALVLLSACVQQPKEPTFDVNDMTKVGYVVGIVGADDPHLVVGSFSVGLCERGTERSFWLNFIRPSELFNTDKPKGYIAEDSFVGMPFAFKVPSGTYDICDAVISTYPATLRYKGKLVQPLVIQPGKSNYIGHYTALPAIQRHIIWGTAGLGRSFQVVAEDKQAADLERIRAFRPEIDGFPLVTAVPNPESLVAPYFIPKKP